jgi:hypothetical protein
MKFASLLAATTLILSTPALSAPAAAHAKAQAKHPPRSEARAAKKPVAKEAAEEYFKPGETRSAGTVIVGGQPLNYDAIAGTLVVHAKDWEDTAAI